MTNKQNIKVISIIFIIIGLVGWLLPNLITHYRNTNNFEVRNLKLTYPNEIVDEIKLYIPEGDGQFPAIVLGSGAGADKALYRNWARGFVNQGFVVLLRSQSYGRKNKEPWIDSRDDTVKALNYLKKLGIVDNNKLLVGGHSGSANVAYWVGYKIPDELRGIIAVAGRFPPKNKGKLKNNVFLGTGALDKLVPPKKITEVTKKLIDKEIKYNTLYGNFNEKNAVKIFISEKSNHLTEAWDNDLIKEMVKFASLSVGKSNVDNYNLENISISKLIMNFLAGMILLIGIIFYFQQAIITSNSSNIILIFSSLVYFIIFFIIWSTTISSYLVEAGPYIYKWDKYLLITIVMLINGIGLKYFVKKYNKKNSFFIDVFFIIISITLFIFISSFFVFIPSFSYGGSMILFKSIIVFIPIFILAILFKKLNLFLIQRIFFYCLSFIWLLPIVIPPK